MRCKFGCHVLRSDIIGFVRERTGGAVIFTLGPPAWDSVPPGSRSHDMFAASIVSVDGSDVGTCLVTRDEFASISGFLRYRSDFWCNECSQLMPAHPRKDSLRCLVLTVSSD